MKILSVISQKGGVGKTTLATALAVQASAEGKTAVIFDLDPQASASFWADIRGTDAPQVRDIKLARLEIAVAAARKAGTDLLILDCPPIHKDVVLEAGEPADFVLIPTRADILDIRAMQQTVKMLAALEKPCAAVLTFCPPVGQEVDEARAIIEKVGIEFCPVQMHHRKAYSRAQQTGQTAAEFEPQGKAAEEIRNLYAYTHKKLFGVKSHGAKEKDIPRRRA